MDANKITDIENDGLNMEADAEFLYVRACREMIKYSRADMSIAARNKVFAKDGKARAALLQEKYLQRCLRRRRAFRTSRATPTWNTKAPRWISWVRTGFTRTRAS
jgi:hypothetical protein